VPRRPLRDAIAPPVARLAAKGVTGLGPDDYDRARRAYLATGTIEATAKEAGLTRSAVEHLVYVGLVELELPPLRSARQRVARQVVAKANDREKKLRKAIDEQDAAAAAAVLEERREAATQLRRHETEVLGSAVESRADELRLVKMNRMGAIVLAGATSTLLDAMNKLAAHVQATAGDPEKMKGMHPRDVGQLIRTIAGTVHRAADTARIAVQMERLLMGEPTAIVESRDSGPDVRDMSAEDAQKWFELAGRAFARRNARSRVIEAAAESRAVEKELEELIGDEDDDEEVDASAPH